MEHADSDPLLIGLAAGNLHDFGVLYDRFASRLYRVAVSMLASREDAEDAVQEVFVSLVRSRQRLGEVRDLEAYLFVSLRRAAGRSAVRRLRLRTAAESTLQQVAARPERQDQDELGRQLRRARKALPPPQQEVVALKIDGGLTFAQIGAVMGTSVNTAASRYRYALEKLRELLGKDYS